jgi:enamine deaminase RidA (YjgF/YER057c/UK114 family)
VIRRRIETDRVPPSTGFRSQGLIAAGLLFSGGQIGAPLLPDGEVRAPAATFEEQVALCLGHLDALSRAAGTAKERVVEVSAFVVPADKQAYVRAQTAAFLGRRVPLFHSVNVSDVALHGLIEMDWVAAMPDGPTVEQAVAWLAPFGRGAAVAKAGPFVMLNGLVAAGSTMTEQSENLLARAAELLEASGSALQHLVKMTVYIAAYDLYPEFNEVTKVCFASFVPPTRSVVVAPDITGEALLRIDFLALAGGCARAG